MAREYLSSRGVQFTEKNVRASNDAVRELVEQYKSNATPTLVAGGRVVIGFDPARYDEALAAAGK